MDSVGAYEKVMHSVLRIAPYRCAWCDKRFLDYKITAPAFLSSLATEHPWVGWRIRRAHMTASRVGMATTRLLKTVRRRPLGDLKSNSLLAAGSEGSDGEMQNSL
jgi:hypothetical protein